MSKKVLLALLTLAMVFALAACGDANDPGTNGAENVKVGFVYIGSVTDGGYTQASDIARIQLEEELGVETMYIENVPENADCEKAIRDLIDQGCNVIFTTSFGYMDWTHNVAKEYPDLKFAHATGYTTDTNMSAYMGRMYEPRYLSGIVAGMKTETNKIGYVAAMPIPEVVRQINAFTLGVRSVNPEATVEVKWTNSWSDASLEKVAALELLNKGCDVMAQHVDTTAAQIAAQEKGVFAIGSNYDSHEAAPQAFLTAPVWNWAAYYIPQVKAVMDGTWASSNYWGHMSEGIVDLAPLSDLCAEGTQEAVDAAKAAILSGENKIFVGPIKDNAGNEKVAADMLMTDEELLSFDWFVEGVIGSI